MRWVCGWLERAFRRSGVKPPALRHAISRSARGRATIRFTGGPVYPEMVDDLQGAFDSFADLLEAGEELSAEEWITRIIASGRPVRPAELRAIRTLMEER